MYIVIKKDKAERLEDKFRHIKTLACEVLECFEEMSREHVTEDPYAHEMARGRDSRGRYRDHEREGYLEDDYRDMARGRGRGRY